LNHAPLSVTIAIEDENINEVKYSIAKNSEEEANFVKEVLFAIKKSTFQIYRILANLKKLLIHSHQISILHGTRIANMSKSQNILRAGGTKNAIMY